MKHKQGSLCKYAVKIAHEMKVITTEKRMSKEEMLDVIKWEGFVLVIQLSLAFHFAGDVLGGRQTENFTKFSPCSNKTNQCKKKQTSTC